MKLLLYTDENNFRQIDDDQISQTLLEKIVEGSVVVFSYNRRTHRKNASIV